MCPTEMERPSPRYSRIDVWEPTEILEAMIEAQFSAVAAVRASRSAIERAGLAIARRLSGRGRLIYVGRWHPPAVWPSRTGRKLMPTFSWPQERLLLLIAGGKDALLRAVEGAEDQVGRASVAQQSGSSGFIIEPVYKGIPDILIGLLWRACRQRFPWSTVARESLQRHLPVVIFLFRQCRFAPRTPRR